MYFSDYCQLLSSWLSAVFKRHFSVILPITRVRSYGCYVSCVRSFIATYSQPFILVVINNKRFKGQSIRFDRTVFVIAWRHRLFDADIAQILFCWLSMTATTTREVLDMRKARSQVGYCVIGYWRKIDIHINTRWCSWRCRLWPWLL